MIPVSNTIGFDDINLAANTSIGDLTMKVLISLALWVALSLSFTTAHAGEPTCSVDGGGNSYCRYSGKVDRIYVNERNTILIYFDTRLPAAVAADAGFTGTVNATAAAYRITDNKDFANLLYSTALTAQASDREIIIQMRDRIGQYLKIDRIWLAAPK